MLLFEALRQAECPICLAPLAAEQDDDKVTSTQATAPPSTCTSSFSPTAPTSGGDFFRIAFGPAVSSLTSSTSAALPLGENEVIVLRCGHFLHALCSAQLYEYSKNPSCPVCRTPIYRLEDDAIKFSPRTRPMQVHVTTGSSPSSPASTTFPSSPNAGPTTVLTEIRQPSSTPAESQRVKREREERPSTPEVLGAEEENDDDAIHMALSEDDSEGDDITIVGERVVPLPQVYREQLGRATAQHKQRADTILARGRHLEDSKRQLQQDCEQLSATLASARTRYDVLTNKEKGGTRLLELRALAAETKKACDTSAADLAHVTRENAELKRQVEKYTRKLGRMN